PLISAPARVCGVVRLPPPAPFSMCLPPGATAAYTAQLRQAFGLDRSIPAQYLIWLGKLASGDFGISIHFRRNVIEMVLVALPATLELLAVGLMLGIAAGIAGGLAMFAWRGTVGEQAVELRPTVMMSIPEL